MAEAGNVDGSMAMATQAESYHSQHDALHKSLTTPERIMTVCDVCGVFINSTDNEQRRQVNLVKPRPHCFPSSAHTLHLITLLDPLTLLPHLWHVRLGEQARLEEPNQ